MLLVIDCPCSRRKRVKQPASSSAGQLDPFTSSNADYSPRVPLSAAFQSVIPVSTGLARGIERLLPELAGLTVSGDSTLCLPSYSCMEPARILKPGHRSSKEDAVGGMCAACAFDMSVVLMDRRECPGCHLIGDD